MPLSLDDEWDVEPLTEGELHALADVDESDDPLTVTIRRTLNRAHVSGLVYGGNADLLDPSGWTKSTLPAVAHLIAVAVKTVDSGA